MLALLLIGCALVSDADLASRLDIDGDGVSRPDDCDDKDANVGAPATFHADADADGFGGGTESQRCTAGGGYVLDATDCDDTRADINPSADELCNAIDDNCDGVTDEDAAVDAHTWYLDTDLDGYGGDTTLAACSAPSGYVAPGGDCNDADAAINPGEREVCDGRDEDCSGVVDDPYWYPDADLDSYGRNDDAVLACVAPAGHVERGGDCEDGDAQINPGADEVCDGLDADEDCDGLADDNDPDTSNKPASWTDADGDGYGDVSRPGPSTCALADGYSRSSADCEDSDASVHPDADDACYDSLDANCDAWDDDDCDHDDCADDAHGGADCDDADPAVHPGTIDVCSDAIDNDCDGTKAPSCGLFGEASLADASSSYTGDTEGASMGSRFGNAIDMTGDGRVDLVISAPGRYPAAAGEIVVMDWARSGSASISTGSAHVGGLITYGFASDFVAADLNVDGVGDLLVYGSSWKHHGVGLYAGPLAGNYGSSGAPTSFDAETGGSLGYVLAASDDLTGDGFPDVATLVVDALSESSVGVFTGAGATTDIALSDVTISSSAGKSVGWALASGGDCTGDGIDDLLSLVLANTDNETWIAVFAGPLSGSRAVADYDGAITPASGANLVYAQLRLAGDTDADGTGDLVVGAPSDASRKGRVYLFSGRCDTTTETSSAGATVSNTATSTNFGTSLGGNTDVDADGRADVLIGAGAAPNGSTAEAGAVYLFVGPIVGGLGPTDATGTLHGIDYGDYAGTGLLGAADVDEDGYGDVLIGAPSRSETAVQSGVAYLLFGGPP